MKKKTLNYLLVAVSIAITVYIIFRNTDLNTILGLFAKSNKLFIFCGLLAMVMFWFLDSVIIYILSPKILGDSSLFASFKTTIIGQYYGMLTPFAAGTQPSQLIYMTEKNKTPLGEASAVLLNKYIFYEVTVTLYSLILFLLKGYLSVSIPLSVMPFVITGLAVHIFGILFIVFIIYSPKAIEKVLKVLVDISCKIKLLKNKEGKFKGIENYISDYGKSITLLNHNIILCMQVFIVSFFEVSIYFSITFFVYKALHLTGQSFIQLVALQSFVYMSVSFVPIPGNIGTSEMSFYALFSPVFGANLITYSLLLWRGIIFYFNLIATGILSGIFNFRKEK